MTEISDITLSIAVTGHAEGRLLRPTLRSIAAAMRPLIEQGTSCELLILLDNPTPETVREAEHWAQAGRLDAPVRIERTAHGDAGASRNAAAQHARGEYVAFCDGDDLVTSNYFTVALGMLAGSAGALIIHPATVLSFGARSAIWHIPATEDVDHQDLIRHNLWPSSSVSRRETYLAFPYVELPHDSGLGPEDWLWNIETSIARISHRPAPDTMFFYRVRDQGGVNNRHLSSILPPFDLDGLVAAMPVVVRPAAVAAAPTARSRVRSLARSGYRMALPLVRVLTSSMDQGRKERLYARAQRLYRRASPPPSTPANIVAALREAAELEPALSWTANGYLGLPVWNAHNDGYSALLVSVVAELRGHARAIVAVPWVGIGGADLVSLNYAKTLAASPRFSGEVSMLATYLPARTLRHLVPEGVNFVQIPEAWRHLTPDIQRRFLAQVLLLVNPDLVVSVNCFDVTHSLQLYARPLTAGTRYHLTMFAFDRIGDGYPVNPITDDSQRSYLDQIGGIITDNSVTQGLVSEMLALDASQIRVHYQPALDPVPPLRTGTRTYNNRYFSAANPFRVIWPHRLDKEKRPDALIEIARLLRELELPVSLHVHGQQVLSDDGEHLMKSLAAAGIEYHGPYGGGLAALPTEDYHALLLTSESEGLPLVLVQSMLLGLPVISSAVGGVTDIVRDNETGLLASGPDDAEGFVRGIRYLLDSLEERRRIVRTAYDFAVAQHGWEHFADLVDSLSVDAE